ncbi:glycosyltransferase family 4 protein [Vibrio sp. D404a]|uniref:glycosyltransferase family 4 protein n=1 Tax=unclassified Vibrio TaxID=2614977 RepID=UPI002554D46B|nr:MULTISPECIES: glycosyltransferase family 4 protein [unclassified Vibrio]MDK9737721.1 glycosyltransferase family 4 protein [Vibrio sp. D404a]MDK9795323.1 glycosyltransferase family 4 protein [Vibrio sp. D449a]
MNKVVLSANTSWYLYNFRSSTINAFQKNGFKVVCLSPVDGYSQKLVDELGCEWFHLEMDNKGSNPIKDLALVYRLFWFYRKVKPVVVFNFTIKNNIYGTWASRLNGVKAINNVSGLGTAFINNNLTSKVVKLLYRLSQPFASKVFCQNPEDMEVLISNKLVHKNKLTLLPGSGVNIYDFEPSIKVNRDVTEPFRFLFVGRMLGDKGVRELISAAHKLAESGYIFTLDLCGFAGVDNASALSCDELKELSKSDYINWIGPSNTIAQVYANADCVVLPSYREGMPRTLLEAGAMGLPSITTDVPGCKHVITHGFNGLLCKVKSSDSLYKKMVTMLQLDDESYSRMCLNSRSRIEKDYDEQIVVQHALDSVMKIYEAH